MSAVPEPTEEQIRAYEEQLSRITTTEVALQTAASLLNIGGRRLGLSSPEAAAQRDLEQVRDAIDGVKALLPIVERRTSSEQLRPLREALSQLQMAYAHLVQQGAQAQQAPSSAPTGSTGAPGSASGAGSSEGSSGPPRPQEGPGPAESSGRLWVPGR